MEEQGKEWQPAASLRELAALSELKRDVVKVKAIPTNVMQNTSVYNDLWKTRHLREGTIASTVS